MANLILVVEDDPKSMELTRDLLQVEGYQTIEATDGKQGVQLAKAKKPDLILMDIMMPGLDGIEVCKRLREAGDVPILMLTAKGTVSDRVVGLECAPMTTWSSPSPLTSCWPE